MIRREIYLEQYGWKVLCYIWYSSCDVDEICGALEGIGCNGLYLESAYRHLMQPSNERGLTYSNVRMRESVVAVGATERQEGSVNTIGHELLHVVAHICDNEGITMQSEEPCYIMGELCEKTFSILRETGYLA